MGTGSDRIHYWLFQLEPRVAVGLVATAQRLEEVVSTFLIELAKGIKLETVFEENTKEWEDEMVSVMGYF